MQASVKIFAISVMLQCTTVLAGPITYNVDLSVGDGGIYGTMTTSGKIGFVYPEDITSWDLILDDGIDLFSLTSDNSTIFDSNGLQANELELFFRNAGVLLEFFLIGVPDYPESDESVGSFYVKDFYAQDLDIFGIDFSISHECCFSPSPPAPFSHGTQMTVLGYDPIIFATVPAPATLPLVFLGLGGLSFARRRKA